jgi:hypothetical protein
VKLVQGITHRLEILFLISIVLHVAGGQDVVLGEMLSKPYPAGAMMTAAITYTNEKHGTVPSVYIKCLQDKVIVPEVQDFLIELNQISQVLKWSLIIAPCSQLLKSSTKFFWLLLTNTLSICKTQNNYRSMTLQELLKMKNYRQKFELFLLL